MGFLSCYFCPPTFLGEVFVFFFLIKRKLSPKPMLLALAHCLLEGSWEGHGGLSARTPHPGVKEVSRETDLRFGHKPQVFTGFSMSSTENSPPFVIS